MGINREGGFTFAPIEKVTSTQTSAPVKSELIVWPPQQQEPRKREPDGQVVSIRRAADESREIVNEKKTGPRTNSCGTPRPTQKKRFL